MNFFTQYLRRWYRSIPRDGDQILWKQYLLKLALKLTAWFFGLSIGIVLLYWIVPVPATALMFQRCWEQWRDPEREVRLKHDWVPYEKISKYMQLAVVCSEDQEFLEHEGFDFEAIEKAYKYNQKHKRKRGASTISQQTAKNVFLWPSRSWIRKGFEVYFTFIMELFWDKKRIMTVYLNSIEFGDGIYGCEAAAQHYFGKSAEKLNRREAALLAAVLPNPIIYKADKPSRTVLDKQAWILNQMRMWKNDIDYEDPNTPRKNN